MIRHLYWPVNQSISAISSSKKRKPFTFELFFCLANAGFFTFS